MNVAFGDYKAIRRWAALGVQILAVAVAYCAFSRLDLLLGVVHRQASPWWPPMGVALASLLMLGVRIWPGITFGAFVANLWVWPSLPAVVVISVGSTLAPLCAYLLLKRVGFRTELDRVRDALALVFLGAMVAMLVSATVGTGALVLAHVLPVSQFWPSWSVWCTGDAMGVLVITPLLLVLRRARWPRGISPYRLAEAAALLLGTTLAAVVATNIPFAWHLQVLVFPFLIWAAMRFYLVGVALCALIVSTTTSYAAAAGIGPFADHDHFVDMVTLHAFNAIGTLSALLLAAVIAERNQANQELGDASVKLVETITRLERSSPRQGEILEAMRRVTQAAKR